MAGEVYVGGLGWVPIRDNAGRVEFERTGAVARHKRNATIDEFSARRFAGPSRAMPGPALTPTRQEYLRQMHAALGTAPAKKIPILRGDLVDGLLAPHGFERHLGLELGDGYWCL